MAGLIPSCRQRQTGFSYVGVLFVLSILAIVVAGSAQLGAVVQRKQAEAELLYIGAQFRNALLSYAAASPPGKPRWPVSLNELLRDSRYPGPKRHLRAIYVDPMTGTTNWTLVMSADGAGIIGVHSPSTRKPVKIGDFPPGFEQFSAAATYQGWVFGPPQ